MSGTRPIGVGEACQNLTPACLGCGRNTKEIAEWHIFEDFKGICGVGTREYGHGLGRRSCFYLDLASNTHWTPEEFLQNGKLPE
jgi:hypothetical protein